ncbi:MAG TPA: S41 family peptidase, partial [Thermoanaerobaculia bacterium]
DIKLTDSGRTMYGGGGITPDVKIAAVKSNHFQDTTLQHYAFFNFAKHYSITHHVTKSFEVDDVLLQDFRKFLDEQKIPYSEADMLENNDWIRSNIKSELFVDAFGQEEGLKVRAEGDPQILKALDLLPQAKQLSENAHKVIAERTSARVINR